MNLTLRMRDILMKLSPPLVSELESIIFRVNEISSTIIIRETGELNDPEIITRVAGLTIHGAGSVITTGIKADLYMPFAATITAVTMLADTTGSIVVDIWKDAYDPSYPPTDADSITGTNPPTISSATKSQDTLVTGWNTAIEAGDTLRFNVDSVSTITRLHLSLTLSV